MNYGKTILLLAFLLRYHNFTSLVVIICDDIVRQFVSCKNKLNTANNSKRYFENIKCCLNSLSFELFLCRLLK